MKCRPESLPHPRARRKLCRLPRPLLRSGSQAATRPRVPNSARVANPQRSPKGVARVLSTPPQAAERVESDRIIDADGKSIPLESPRLKAALVTSGVLLPEIFSVPKDKFIDEAVASVRACVSVAASPCLTFGLTLPCPAETPPLLRRGCRRRRESDATWRSRSRGRARCRSY
jgi:hypothetical protein